MISVREPDNLPQVLKTHTKVRNDELKRGRWSGKKGRAGPRQSHYMLFTGKPVSRGIAGRFRSGNILGLNGPLEWFSSPPLPPSLPHVLLPISTFVLSVLARLRSDNDGLPPPFSPTVPPLFAVSPLISLRPFSSLHSFSLLVLSPPAPHHRLSISNLDYAQIVRSLKIAKRDVPSNVTQITPSRSCRKRNY